MTSGATGGFLLAVLPLIATPGASLALLLREVAAGGRRRGLPVIGGTACGLAVHATLAVAGLSAVVMHSARAFTALRLAGAGYLLALGLWTLLAGRRPARPARRRGHSAYGQALLGNVLNPKAASIYLTLLPQFVDPARPVAGQILTLSAAHATLLTAWLLAWTALAGTASTALRAPRTRRALDRLTGTVLLALGTRAALT